MMLLIKLKDPVWEASELPLPESRNGQVVLKTR